MIDDENLTIVDEAGELESTTNAMEYMMRWKMAISMSKGIKWTKEIRTPWMTKPILSSRKTKSIMADVDERGDESADCPQSNSARDKDEAENRLIGRESG